MEFSLQMYRYCHGNCIGTMTFVWRVPTNSPEDPTSAARAIADLNSKQKLYSTREMRKDFLSKYRQFVKAPVSILRHLYKDLIHDCSAPSSTNEYAMDERVTRAIIELENPDIILDLRKNNGKVNLSLKISGKNYKNIWTRLLRP